MTAPTPANLERAKEIAKTCLHGAHITWPDDLDLPSGAPTESEWDIACPACIALALDERDRRLAEAENAAENWKREAIRITGVTEKNMNRVAALVAALEWYKERASATQRYMETKPPKVEALTALMTELALDAGSRADTALAAARRERHDVLDVRAGQMSALESLPMLMSSRGATSRSEAMTPDELVARVSDALIDAEPVGIRFSQYNAMAAAAVRVVVEACAETAYSFTEPMSPNEVDTGRIWRSSQATAIAQAIRALAALKGQP